MKQLLYGFVVILLFGLLGAGKQSNDSMETPDYPSYEKQWQEVDLLRNEGKSKDAKAKVEAIYQLAKTEQNAPQIYKSLLVLATYINILEEDSDLTIIHRIEDEIEESPTPTKQILQSALANLYWQYFQNNRYRFYNRTTTDGGLDEADFRTWDQARIISAADAYYSESIHPSKELSKYAVDDFKDILVNRDDRYKKYRPTMYDLLAHQAIAFYANDESGTNKPTDQFQIRDEKAFGSAKQFISYKPSTSDRDSYKIKVIEIYQDLLKSKINNSDQASSFIHTDIQRLKFIRSQSNHSGKEELYEKGLKRIYDSNLNEDVSIAGFELAQLYFDQGSAFQPGVTSEDDSSRTKLIEALAIIEDVAEKYPNSFGAINNKNLELRIKEVDFFITQEQQIQPYKPFKFLVRYKNINQVDFHMVKADDTMLNLLETANRRNGNIEKFVENYKPDYEWTVNTPKADDYQNHTFETVGLVGNNADISKSPDELGLAPGSYIMWLTEPGNQIDVENTRFSIFQVSDISYFTKDQVKGQNMYIVNHTTGEPMPRAKISITAKNYNQGTRTFNFQADENGVAKIELPKRYYSQELEIRYKDQTVNITDYRYSGGDYRGDESWSELGYIFTDRSIYRPGQVIYFKSILTKTNYKESEILANERVNVVLRDANYEEVESLSLRSNEFGSVHGTFTIPQGRLLGQYIIDVDGIATQYISVEEYKRPKFKVELNPLEGNYKLNQNVEVEGEAKAFAGSVISDATVSYRVVREVRYPYYYGYWFWYRRPPIQKESQEIAFGETTTDETGKFIIPFTALPDETVNAEDLPVFDYKIFVDIIDLNGETRSASSTVVVGYTSMEISLTEADWEKNEKAMVTIQSNNLNGQPVSANGNLTIFKLEAPDQYMQDRPWAFPEKQLIDESDYRRLFPNEPYRAEESDQNLWDTGKSVFSQKIQTDEEGSQVFDLKTKNLAAGYYKIVAESKDAFGREITTEKVVYLKESEKEDQLADHKVLDIQLNQEIYQPGDEAIITIKTGADNVWLWVDVNRDNEKLRSEMFHLSGKKEEIKIPIKEADRGGIVLTYGSIKYGKIFRDKIPIAVPWTNKDLQIEVNTFRDKLKPGAEETWSFTVKGEKGDAVSAEMITAMYDASLDQFRPNEWSFNPRFRTQAYANQFLHRAISTSSLPLYHYNDGTYQRSPVFPGLNNFGFSYNQTFVDRRDRDLAFSSSPRLSKSAPAPVAEGVLLDSEADFANAGDVVVVGYSEERSQTATDNQKPLEVAARKNLQETAYFLPQLSTDEEGNVTFSFTTPEALTEWKVQAIAHTKELETVTWNGSTVTQKELMVIPNAPRFLRQGDNISFQTKIANLQDKALSGQAELVLLDATTLEPVYSKIGQTSAKQDFTVDAKGNTQVTWDLTIPDDVPAVTYRVLAKAGNFSDGEENALPVLSNRKLVTETMPIALRSNQTKTFVLDKLANNTSNTLKNHRLTLEMTSNPAWYGVQALPYLMEFPYECAEQTFSRYYANSLATHVANSNPKIKSVFDTWRNYQPDALKSNLEKNQELKEILLKETPWVQNAASEAEQKRRIALLFDMNRMATEQQKALNQLKQLQMNSGGFPWFKGGRENRFITQHIVAGLGHLDALNVKDIKDNQSTWSMTQNAVQYLDNELTHQLEELKKYNKDWRDIQSVPYIVVHYFYVRSFFQDLEVSDRNQEAYDFYWTKLKEDWLSQQLYRNGLAALAFHRNGETELADKIVEALDQNSITSEELGMYWKANTASWWWYQAPIETQALMIEVFDEIRDDQNAVDELKVWLLKNKQTNRWETTKATSEAVYALLLRGGNWLSIDDMVDIQLGGEEISPETIDGVEVEAGTGYFKTSWNGDEITKEQATVIATKKGDGIAWGAVYWQYFEDLDKITSAETPLQLNKQLFLQENTKTGPKISPVAEGQALQIGDLLKVRIELKVDRDMEFVHMKDMRAAGFEPTNVFSRYKWQDGLGYYESTKDASTDFFFDYLPKGVYVFEYPLRVNNAGDMSNGITTIQCMYAPEFTSHSEGVRVTVE